MGRHLGPARAGRLRPGVLTPRPPLAIILIALTTLFAACSGGEDNVEPTRAVTVVETEVPTTSAIAPSADAAVTVENAVQACREKDVEALHGFLATDVPDAQIEALFAKGSDVLLSGRSVPAIDGDSAAVDVLLEVHRDGEADQVQRTWQLERGDDNLWRFSALPDCY